MLLREELIKPDHQKGSHMASSGFVFISGGWMLLREEWIIKPELRHLRTLIINSSSSSPRKK